MLGLKRKGIGAKDAPADQVLTVGPIRGQWRQFRALVLEPWTCLLLLASIGLFVAGQWKPVGTGVNALLQILLAVSTGVLGARVTNLVAEASGEGILAARGKVAVRGLKLMLVQTAAFERRVRRFLSTDDHILNHPEVTKRNYEETIEFCRRIQEEAGSAMETWGDVVPSADLSSLIGRITEAEEQRDSLTIDLEAARIALAAKEGDEAEKAKLLEQVTTLSQQKQKAEARVIELTTGLANRAVPENIIFTDKGYHDAVRKFLSMNTKDSFTIRIPNKDAPGDEPEGGK